MPELVDVIDSTTVLAAYSVVRRPFTTRLAEHVSNVKDFDAKGDGTTDDRAAIQAAIDWTASHQRGVIFFPHGNYLITGPLVYAENTPDHSIIFRGAGAGSHIKGDYNGFLFDRSTLTIPGLADNPNPGLVLFENLALTNNNTGAASGAIHFDNSFMVEVRNCKVLAFRGIILSGDFGVVVSNVSFLGLPGIHPNSIGLYVALGGPAHISGCDFYAIHDGLRMGTGSVVVGNRFENCGNAINVGTHGYDGAGSSSAIGGALLMNNGMEANDVGVWCRAMYHSTLLTQGMHGHSAGFYAGYGAGGTGPAVGNEALWSTSGIRLGQGWNNTFISCQPFDSFSQAAIVIEDATIGPNTWISCSGTNAGTSYTGSTTIWSLGGANHRGHKFINCTPPFDPVMTFAALPTGTGFTGGTPTGDVGRAKGTKFFITDGGAQTIGASVTVGGGSTFMEVMWNGTNWTRCA